MDLHASQAGRDLSQVEDQFDADARGFHVLMNLHHFRAAAMNDAAPAC